VREKRVDKIIVVNYDKCIGCKTCEAVCSLMHEGRINPSESRINVVKYEDIGINIPVFCQKCEDPACSAACPMDAIIVDDYLGTYVDYSRCIGCKMCILACPIGGVSLHPANKKIIMCDLCKGNPQCVASCPEQALEYVDVGKLSIKKRREGLEKLAKFLEMAKI
jgi:Fe-S-cluster-containing hydrogenase component 2